MSTLKAKGCWLAKETKRGWKLYLCIGEKLTFLLPGLTFNSESDVKKALHYNIVFVHRGGTK